MRMFVTCLVVLATNCLLLFVFGTMNGAISDQYGLLEHESTSVCGKTALGERFDRVAHAEFAGPATIRVTADEPAYGGTHEIECRMKVSGLGDERGFVVVSWQDVS